MKNGKNTTAARKGIPQRNSVLPARVGEEK